MPPIFDLFFGLLQSLHGLPACAFVFTLLFLCGIGAPLSQDILLLAAASLTLQGAMQPLPLMVAAWLGLLAGDALTFYTGHRFGADWIRRPWAARIVPPQRLPGMEAALRRFGAPFAFVTRWLPGQRVTLFFAAGTLRMPWRTFLLWDGVAAVLHVALLVMGVRALGWRWQSLQAPVARADDVLTAALVLLVLLLWLRGRHLEKRP